MDDEEYNSRKSDEGQYNLPVNKCPKRKVNLKSINKLSAIDDEFVITEESSINDPISPPLILEHRVS